MRKVGEPLRSRVDDHRHDVDAGTANRSLCASPQDVQQASTAPPRIHVVGRVVIAGTRVANVARMDFTQYPMGLLGGLVALFVFGVFIGMGWWYGMREMTRRATTH